MTEDRVEGLLYVQRRIAETLEICDKLYDRQCEQLQQQQNLIYKLYVIPYPPKLANTCRK